MDLRNAFDIINHDALLLALRHREVPEPYIVLIDLLYSDQMGRMGNSRKFR